jgi:hypothetical protein
LLCRAFPFPRIMQYATHRRIATSLLSRHGQAFAHAALMGVQAFRNLVPRGAQNRERILAAKILMVFSASIILTLGAVHLVYTFWGPMLTPRDPALQISMSQTSPVITKETTMWRCWVGFNASHSMGLILFGLVFGFLALAHGQLLFQSPFLLVVGLAMLGGFVVLCKVYFFSAPLTGISISLACYVASVALSRA